MHSRLQSLLADVAQAPVSFMKGQLIYDEGEPSDGIYRVVDGRVRLQISGEDGSRQIVRFLARGDFFGLCPQYRATAAEAVTPVRLIRYSLSSIFGGGTVTSSLARGIIHEEAASYQELAHHISQTNRRTAFDRVKAFYEGMQPRIIDKRNPTSEFVISQRDVADYLGITPETMSRCMSRLKAQKNWRDTDRRAASAGTNSRLD